MLNNPTEAPVAPEATHIGWRTSPNDAAQGMDHLVLGDAWNPTPGDLRQPLVEFINQEAAPSGSKPQTQEPQFQEPNFQAMEDTLLEPGCRLWGGDSQEDQLEAAPLVVFGEDPDTDQDQTVFS